MARWTAEEHNTLLSLLEDGVLIQTLCDAIPNKTEGAIVTRARNKKLGLDYRTSRKDGKLYEGVKRRQKTKADIGEVSSERTTIVGEVRVTAITQEPTKSERTNQNISDDIVTNNSTDITKNEFISIYDEITSLFSNSKFHTLQSISIATSSETITVVKNFKV